MISMIHPVHSGRVTSEQMRELEERHEDQLHIQYRMELQTAEEFQTYAPATTAIQLRRMIGRSRLASILSGEVHRERGQSESDHSCSDLTLSGLAAGQDDPYACTETGIYTSRTGPLPTGTGICVGSVLRHELSALTEARSFESDRLRKDSPGTGRYYIALEMGVQRQENIATSADLARKAQVSQQAGLRPPPPVRNVWNRQHSLRIFRAFCNQLP